MKVFISYRRDTGLDAARLAKGHLEKAGHKVFMDIYNYRRGNYMPHHEKAIQNSHVLVLILSIGSLDKCCLQDDPVAHELRLAKKYHVDIIPYFKHDFETPNNLPADLTDIPQQEGANEDLHKPESGFDRILELMGDDPHLIGIPSKRRHLTIWSVLIASLLLLSGYLYHQQRQPQLSMTLNATADVSGITLSWTHVYTDFNTFSNCNTDIDMVCYTLSRKVDSTTWLDLAILEDNIYTDHTVYPDNTYSYRITAKANGKTLATAEQTIYYIDNDTPVSLVMQPANTAPVTAPPIVSTATPSLMRLFATPGAGQVQLSWTETPLSGTVYTVERRAGENGTWQQLARTKDTVYTDTTARSALLFQYRVTAWVDGKEYNSAICTGTPITLTTQPPAYASYLPVIPEGGVHANCTSKSSIKWVQQCLRRIQGTLLAVDGSWGSVTEEAVLRFKREYGFPDDNAILSAEMLHCMLDVYVQKMHPLEYLTPYAAGGASGAGVSLDQYMPVIPAGGIHASCGNKQSIMWVQQCLRRIGYGSLAVDGNWGSATDSAVLAFKRSHGFTTSSSVLLHSEISAMLEEYYLQNQPLEFLEGYAAR